MAFFKRELSPVERFDNTLRTKQAARQKLADRLKTPVRAYAAVEARHCQCFPLSRRTYFSKPASCCLTISMVG